MRGTQLALFCLSCTAASAAELDIQKPENDRLTMSSAVDVEGSGSPDNSAVQVTANGKTYRADVLAGKWTAKEVALMVGANMITVQLGDKTRQVLAVRGADNVATLPSQDVRFLWKNGVEDELRGLAVGSLDNVPTTNELNAFVDQVKARTIAVFEDYYKGIADIKVVANNSGSAHIIYVVSINAGEFGNSPLDCGNRHPASEATRIYVGALRREMTQQSGPDGFILGWGPMRRSDSLSIRTEDVAQALGRTSAHEFGHSLGLVGGDDDSACIWMGGCDGSHNCAAFDFKYPLAHRFGGGQHVMDPGENTLNNLRLAEPDPAKRSSRRAHAIFSTFSASYLQIIHPVP